MSRNRLIGLLGALLAVAFGLVPAASLAGHLDRTETVDGIVVRLGIVPAELLRQDEEHFGEHNWQCPPPRARDSHHVLVALFDATSGERITDAEVMTRVSPLGLVGPRKHLHPESVAEAVTYCNYFDLAPRDTYIIDVDIRRPGSPKVIRARFEYKPDCCR